MPSPPGGDAGGATNQSFELAARIASGVRQEFVAFQVGHIEKISSLALGRGSKPIRKFRLRKP